MRVRVWLLDGQGDVLRGLGQRAVVRWVEEVNGSGVWPVRGVDNHEARGGPSWNHRISVDLALQAFSCSVADVTGGPSLTEPTVTDMPTRPTASLAATAWHRSQLP